MSKYPSQMQDKFNLRFPDGMRDAIAERAKANGRSMNSEIIQILQDALSEEHPWPEVFPEGVSKPSDFDKMVRLVNEKTEDFKNNLLAEILEYAAFHPDQPPVEAKQMRQELKNKKPT
ncbi:Arc family DNA-binding protein [Pantoea sp. UYEF8]|uniref:Arc family DNA-binding protein n=1 Tax=Pantoea sp. UYEF8 TaxID=1756394 RepID=UPI00339413FB